MGAAEFARGGELAASADRQRADGGHEDRLVVEARSRRLEGFDRSAWQVDVETAVVANIADNPDRERSSFSRATAAAMIAACASKNVASSIVERSARSSE